MQVRLAFGRDGLAVTLPSGYDYKLLECPPLAAVPDASSAIEEALERPTAGPPLSQLAAGKKSAAISVCDITRPAPNPVTLPPLLRRLEASGIARENIRIMIATGLHRPATEAEIRHIVSEGVAARYQVLNHDARNMAQHRRLGTSSTGTPVWIDERFMSADLKLTLGFIEPHLMLGFSGGRKLVAPGLAGEATIKELHSPRFMRDPRSHEGSIVGNPLHAELLEIARMAGQSFILDVALNRERGIAAVFTGEPEAAHRQGMDWVAARTLQRVGEPFDAAITTGAGFPLDLTFYQTVKGVTAAAEIVKQGGRILVFGECSEGAGAPEFRKMMTQYRNDQDFLKAIERAPVTIDQWQLEKLALSTRKASVSYCVPGLPEPYMSALWGPGFHKAEEALGAFFTDLAPGSRVAVIPEGPYVLASAGAA